MIWAYERASDMQLKQFGLCDRMDRRPQKLRFGLRSYKTIHNPHLHI